MLKRFLLALALAFAPMPALAQNVTTINGLPAAVAPLGGGEFVPVWQGSGTKKAKLSDILTVFKGSSAPGTPYFGEYWWNTSAAPADQLEVYDGAQWVVLATLNTSTHSFVVDPSLIGANSIANTKLATVAAGTIKGNATGGTATPTDSSVSAYLDQALSSSQGAIPYRGSSIWGALAAGTSGYVLRSNGTSANPSWGPVPVGNPTLFINGALQAAVRNGTSSVTVGTSSVTFTADRWYAKAAGAAITAQRVTGTAPYQYALKLTGATSNTSTGFGQRIISANSCGALSQTIAVQAQIAASNATSVTWTAYYANSVDNFGGGETSIATGSITINSTPAIYSFTFGAGANACNGIDIVFSTGALTSGQTIQYAGLKAELNSAISAFVYADYKTLLDQCEFYYKKWQPGVLNAPFPNVVLTAQAANRVGGYIQFGSAMRVPPTLAIITGVTYTVFNENSTDTFNPSETAWSAISTTGALWNDQFISGNTFTTNYPIAVRAGSTSAAISADAETY